jgi:hypothetical protein
MDIAEGHNLLYERMCAARDASASHLVALSVKSPTSLSEVAAVGFDTNILKLLRRDPSDADQLFLTLKSSGVALIAPAQTIIEYWNNHQVFASEEWTRFQADLAKVSKLIDSGKLGGYDQGAVQHLQKLVGEVSDDLLEAKNPEFFVQASALIEALLEQASSPQVSRLQFSDLAAIRQASKTPPGFADEKLKIAASGDFFVWCDLLLGALTLDPPARSNKFVWVTDDSKPDWKTGTAGHPSLVEEFQWVAGGELSILSYGDFRRLVKTSAGTGISDPVTDLDDDAPEV